MLIACPVCEQELKKKERELKAKEEELKRKEQVCVHAYYLRCRAVLLSFILWIVILMNLCLYDR